MKDEFKTSDGHRMTGEEFESFFNLSLDLLCVAGADGYFKKINPAFTETLGFDEKELLERPLMEFIHPEDRAQTLAEIEKQMAGGTTLNFRNRYICKDGSVRWLSWKALAVAGKGILYATARDVTDEMRAGETLKLQGAIINNMAGGAFLIRSSDSVIVYANPGFEQMFGYGPGEILGRQVSIVNAPGEKTPEETAREINEALKKNGVWSGEVRNVRKDGTPFWCYVNVSTFDHPVHGKVWISVHTDITGRKRAEEEVEKSRQRLILHVQRTPLGVIEWNVDFEVTEWNPAAERIFGYTRHEALGRRAWELVVPESARAHVEKVWQELLLQKGGLRSTNENLTSDGRHIVCEWYNTPLVDEAGSVKGVASLVQDITERARMEKELLKIQKLESLGILAGGIAHDFNNLLTGIIGNLSLLEDTAGKAENTSRRLKEAEKAAFQARDLAQRLLMFSKGWQPVKETIAVGALIRESTDFALSGSNIRCNTLIPGDLWPIDADAGQIAQVINNLVINADQAMPDGGALKVRAENRVITGRDDLPLKEGRYVLVTVEDQGGGIPKELMSKIFDPYFTTKKKGSGLGLAIVYSVVKKHGGHIDVASNPGAGTAFNVYLPASAEDVSPKKKAEEEPLKAQGRILVVDDEVMIRDVAQAILTRFGYEVATAEEGNEAFELYKKAKEEGLPFAAVIMDLTIPGGVGGKDAVGKLLAFDPAARVIVSSGYSKDPIMADYGKYGFCAVITKPYKASELGTKVRTVVSQGRK